MKSATMGYCGSHELFLQFKTSVVELVGGSGPHEGNILVNGQPVCDDGHDVQNAKLAETKMLQHKKNQKVTCNMLELSIDYLAL